MLVLSRKELESVQIGDDITITVVRISRNGSVRIGITAPATVPVHRQEVHEMKRRAKEVASNVQSTKASQ